MARLIPLRGIRYTSAAGDLRNLLAPPYDVVTPAEQREILERDPHNALNLELAAGTPDPYAAAADHLRRWISAGVIARDPEPTFYVYEQAFTERGERLRRRCLLAGVEAQPWDQGAVKPHEYTMSGPKEDRLKLLEAAGAQFSPILMIARDRAGRLRGFIDQVTTRPPDQEATLGDEAHRLWTVPSTPAHERLLAPLAAESFYIADGHHRYETAVEYKRRRLAREGSLPESHPARFVLAGIVAAEDPGLVVRPIHRVVPRRRPDGWEATVSELFTVREEMPGAGGAATARALLAGDARCIVAAGLEPPAFHVLRPRDPAALAARAPAGHSPLWANLQPNVVRYGLLEPLWGIGDEELRAGAVTFTHSEEEALGPSGEEGKRAAFLIHAVPVEDVLVLADQGERLPQKSTFFHPKLATGLVFHPLD